MQGFIELMKDCIFNFLSCFKFTHCLHTCMQVYMFGHMFWMKLKYCSLLFKGTIHNFGQWKGKKIIPYQTKLSELVDTGLGHDLFTLGLLWDVVLFHFITTQTSASTTVYSV